MLLVDLKEDGLELHMGVQRPLAVPVNATQEEIEAINAENERRAKRVRFRLMQRLVPGGNQLDLISTYRDADVTTEEDDYYNYAGDIPITFLAGSIERWIEKELTRLYPDVDPDIDRWTPWLNQLANHLQDDYEVQEDGSLERVGSEHAVEV